MDPVKNNKTVSILIITAIYLMAGALANTVMFLTVSIPLADKRQSQKSGYEEYRAETRSLLPVPK